MVEQQPIVDEQARDESGSTVALMAFAPFMRMLEDAGPGVWQPAFERGQEVLERWGLGAGDLGTDLTVRLPHALVVELLGMFVEVLDDPSAPLRAGQRLKLGDYELLEYLGTSTATLGECIACVGRYYPLLIDAELDLHVEGERAEARFQIKPGLDAPDCLNEFALASNFVMTILHLELAGSQMPLEVSFAHAAPGHAAVFEEVFLSPVRFSAEHNAIVFPVSMLDHPMRSADPILHATLTRQADRELRALASRSAFPGRVREAIDRDLGQGAPMERVAASLHMSEGALRTRLRQHGTSYTTLLDTLRREHAARALRQSQQSVSEIAYALGFANPPAFNRAFRRWFGVTPMAYRESRVDGPVERFFRRRG